MRPGQCIDLEAHAVKGIGADHAKWSPVATAWYRLHPEVVLTKKVVGKQAQELLKLCPGLFKMVKVRKLNFTSPSALYEQNETSCI